MLLALCSGSQGSDRAAVRLVSRSISEASENPRYTIEVHYPQIALATAPSHDRFNREVVSLASGEAAEFKRRLGPLHPGLAGADAGSALQISYAVAFQDDRLISVSFEADRYLAGAVHPQHFTFAYTYDLRAGRKLNLGHLFAPNSRYLHVISEHCMKALARQLPRPVDMNWIRKGAGPAEPNYRSWVVTSRGLQITFDPYQVAPYVEGLQVVVVPYRVLASLIRPGSPIPNH